MNRCHLSDISSPDIILAHSISFGSVKALALSFPLSYSIFWYYSSVLTAALICSSPVNGIFFVSSEMTSVHNLQNVYQFHSQKTCTNDGCSLCDSDSLMFMERVKCWN